MQQGSYKIFAHIKYFQLPQLKNPITNTLISELFFICLYFKDLSRHNPPWVKQKENETKIKNHWLFLSLPFCCCCNFLPLLWCRLLVWIGMEWMLCYDEPIMTWWLHWFHIFSIIIIIMISNSSILLLWMRTKWRMSITMLIHLPFIVHFVPEEEFYLVSDFILISYFCMLYYTF